MSKPVFSDLFSFSSRRDRKSYAVLVVAYYSLAAMLTAMIIVLAKILGPGDGIIAIAIVAFAIFAVTTFPMAAATEQRLNDIGGTELFGFSLTGWFVFAQPFACLFELILIAIPGTRGPNKYGPDPLMPATPATD